MAKSKKKNNNTIKIGNNSYSREIKKVITMFLMVLAFFGLFYLLTIWILGRDIVSSNADDTEEVEIQSSEILVGTSFSVSDEEYLVLYYDADDEDSIFSSLVAQYRSSDGALNLYTVDLSDSLNKQFVTESDSNPSAATASELKLKNPTLIKFVGGKIAEYIDSEEEIKNYLKQSSL